MRSHSAGEAAGRPTPTPSTTAFSSRPCWQGRGRGVEGSMAGSEPPVPAPPPFSAPPHATHPPPAPSRLPTPPGCPPTAPRPRAPPPPWTTGAQRCRRRLHICSRAWRRGPGLLGCVCESERENWCGWWWGRGRVARCKLRQQVARTHKPQASRRLPRCRPPSQPHARAASSLTRGGQAARQAGQQRLKLIIRCRGEDGGQSLAPRGRRPCRDEACGAAVWAGRAGRGRCARGLGGHAPTANTPSAACRHAPAQPSPEGRTPLHHPPLTRPVAAQHGVQDAHEGARVRRHERCASLIPDLSAHHRRDHHGVRMPLGLRGMRRGSGAGVERCSAWLVPSAAARHARASACGPRTSRAASTAPA